MSDMVVWSKERGYYQAQLFYGTNLGAPAIKIENVGSWKFSQVEKANKNFEAKYEELKKELNELMEEVYWNDLIYQSDFSFLPDEGQIYHLYSREDESTFLSIIEPSSWNKKHLGSFRLDSNKKWNKIP